MFKTASGGGAVRLAREVRVGRATLGVRPEHVRCETGGPVRGRVVIDEYLGSARCVHVEAPFGRLVMRTAPSAPRAAGEEVALAFDLERVRLFDPESGRRL